MSLSHSTSLSDRYIIHVIHEALMLGDIANKAACERKRWARAYSVLRPGAYPLVWLNESFLMDDGTRDDLQSSLFTPTKIVKIACWSAVGVGGALMVLSAVLCLVTVNCMGDKGEKKDE
ncbi:hypothetical protein ANCDUO_13614 [Ancylostoma duodenale]|uniref:Uncharacterized protein n=1 Tax=Ancylostoma duodenale TaxID=51022 RepID=A0A0C2GGH4_9BILA|nr:hypothetical protein ANCDUO_13614 [Ancylostoma duodenale]